MRFVSSTDFAIAVADQRGTLRITERESRLGGTYFAIADEFGTIEVQDTQADVDRRLASIRAKVRE